MTNRHESDFPDSFRFCWLRIAGSASLAISIALLLVRFRELESVLGAVARLASTDGSVSAQNRAFFAAFVFGAAVLTGCVGIALFAYSMPRGRRVLATVIGWDALRLNGLRVPNAYAVLACSTALGIGLIALWLLSERLGGIPRTLFAKEGPSETLTFVLDMAAAGLCVAAALRFRLRDTKMLRVVPMLYATCGLLLFVVAMEEINWGQTLFGFKTPGVWAEINYQNETSLHNLIDRSGLTAAWRWVAVAFGAGAVLLVALSLYAPNSIVGAIAPPPSLMILALATSYSGALIHPELIELLLSIFFSFYSYRIFVAARSSNGALQNESDVAAPRHMADTDAHGGLERHAGFSASLRALRIAVPIVLIALLLSRVDWTQAGNEISQTPLWPLFALFVAMVLELIVSTAKWSYALRMHDLRYPFWFLLRALCSGFFLNSFLPSAVGGDVYRVYRTLPADGFRSRALSAVLIERAVGLLALLSLGGMGALLITDQFQVARVYCLLMLGIAVAGAIGIVALERGWLRSLIGSWDKLAPLNAVRHSVGLLSNRGRDWLALLAGSFVFQAMSIGVLFCLFAILSAQATLAQCALIAAMVGAAAVLPISINGIGVMEGALVAGAVMLGIDYDKAVMVAFLRRLLNLSLAASCGVVHVATLGQDRGSADQKGLLSLVAAVSQRTFSYLRTVVQPAEHNVSPLRAPADFMASVPDVPLTSASHGEGSDRNWLHADLLEYTHDAIIIWEMDGGGIKYFNRAAEQLYGYSRDEAHGRTTHELLKTELAGGVDVLEKTLARFGIWVGELRHTTRDGRYVEVEGRLALMSQDSGRWLVLEVNRDVSDRKVAEAARRDMARQLTELRRRSESTEIT